MAKSLSISGKELVRLLIKLGFEVVRVKGSHHFLQHKDGRCTTVPVHSKEIVGPGLFNKILKDCEITNKDLK